MPLPFPQNPSEFCITDVGSTTTKAVLFRHAGNRWRFHRREAATTVEKPHADVTVGVRRALSALAEETGTQLLRDDVPAVPYLSTSSAGGGLAVVVTGLVRQVTSRSAERVALGAGAILLDVIAMDDGRTPYEKIQALKGLRPDMLLLAGGFDGEAISGPVFLAELAREAGLRPKLSRTARLAVLYAGNVHAREFARETLGDDFMFHPVDNIRPSAERENLDPARCAIHDLFMDHVMSQAPGYERLLEWVSRPIVPTPAAFGQILARASGALGKRILAVDIGGATTDVFTAVDGQVERTVSANLGMSYSMLNVAHTAGIAAVSEVLEADLSEEELWDRIAAKYVRPTSLPRTAIDLKVEWAVAAAAIREAVKDHLRVLAGLTLSRSQADLKIRHTFDRRKAAVPKAGERFALSGYDLVIGSGGILSHSDRRAAAMMLINALRPSEPVDLAVDSAFIFPHLGVLSESCPDLAVELFQELGLVRLGPIVRAKGAGRAGEPALRLRGTCGADAQLDHRVTYGSMETLPLSTGQEAALTISGPGAGGQARLASRGGECGLMIDARGDDPAGLRATLAPSAPALPQARGEAALAARVRRGPLRLRRELAIAGKLCVSCGDTVQPETVVARSQRTFLRPFFLEAARGLRLDPGDVGQYLVKQVGDAVTQGDMIARRKVNILLTREYTSPVTGTIERVLPNGTLIVREHPEDATQLSAVPVAKDLRMHPEQIKSHLRVSVGQAVERGQWVAARLKPGDLRISRSPVRGKVKEINLGYGVVTIEPLLEELEVRAWLPGKVAELSDRGCVVESAGVDAEGIWGVGGEVHGTLSLDEDGPGRIVVQDFASAEDLSRLDSNQTAGLIAGGLHLKDVLELDPSLTIVVTEGFGERTIAPEIRAALEAGRGRLTLLDGTTELRVGVRRPRVILPD